MKKEFLEAIKIIRNFNVWSELAYSQIRTRYARTVLGPLWELIGLVFLLVPLAVLWSKLWERPISDFFVYLFTGYSLFRFISTLYAGFARFAGLLTHRCFDFHINNFLSSNFQPLNSAQVRSFKMHFKVFIFNFIFYINI